MTRLAMFQPNRLLLYDYSKVGRFHRQRAWSPVRRQAANRQIVLMVDLDPDPFERPNAQPPMRAVEMRSD